VVGGGDARRHVLHDDCGMARDMLAEMARGDARLQVVAAAGPGTDNEADLLAGVEILAMSRRRTGRQNGEDKSCEDGPDHAMPPPAIMRVSGCCCDAMAGRIGLPDLSPGQAFFATMR
jgi:hypothetical protein